MSSDWDCNSPRFRRSRPLISLRPHWCPASRLRRVLIALSLLPAMTACYVHRAYEPPPPATPIVYHGDVRVLTLRGDVFMLRSVAVSGDNLTGERIFCKSGWGYDENWCKGVRRFPADSSRIAIAVREIQQAHTRSFSAGRTALVAVGITSGLALGILLMIGIGHLAPVT